MNETDIAVVVMSFERHELLRWCLDCLERNADIDNYDFIIIQDGSLNDISREEKTSGRNIMKSLSLQKEYDLPNKRCFYQLYNIGIARMRNEVFKLFDEGYDLIIQIENDLMLGKYALSLLDKMAHQFQDDITTIYRQYPFTSIPDYEERLDEVWRTSMSNAYCFGMWEDTYEEIRDGWEKYMEICSVCDYDNRPHDLIRSQFPGAVSTHSDGILMYLLSEEDIKCTHPIVSRSKYYGHEGHSTNLDGSIRKPYGIEGPAEFSQDKEIEEFVVADRL